MAPVKLKLLTRSGLEADEGLLGLGADRAQIVFEDGEATVKSPGLDPLVDHGCKDVPILLEKLLDQILERIELAGLGHDDSHRLGIDEVFANSRAIEPQGSCDLAAGRSLVGHAMDLEDNSSIDHGHPRIMR